MARRGLNKPIDVRGVQIIGGLGASVCTPGENNGVLGELVHARNTIAADWVGIRYYAVDYDAGNDENVGFSDVSLAAAGLVAMKTLEEMLTRLPKLGQGQRGVVAIKTRAGGATYLKKDGVTPDRLNLDGIYGYFHLLVRGTGDVPSASAVAFANDTNDKIALGAQTAAGAAASYTATGGTTSLITTAAAFPAEPALIGKRIRFDSATTTVALRNATAMAHAYTSGVSITPADNLPAAPVAGDIFYIEEPGVAFETISVTSTTPNVQGASPSFALQGIHLAGFRPTSTAAGGGGFIMGPNACVFSFIDSASTSFTAFSIVTFTDVRMQRSYVDEAGTTIITGVGVRAPGGANASRGSLLIVTSSALVGPGGIGRVQALNINQLSLGSGSYFFIGVLVQGTGNGANSVGAVFTNLVGRGSSTTARLLRILAPAVGAGLNISHGDGTIWGVDITGMGASACILLRGIGQAWSVQGVVGSTGNTGPGLDCQLAKDCHIVLGNVAVNTFTGGAGQDVVGSGTERYVHADYARTDLRDNSCNHLQGLGFSIVGPTVLATNNAVADIPQYNIVFATASGSVQAASAAAAATAMALGVTQSPMTAAGSQMAMLVNGGGTWVQFDAAGAPVANAIAYLSTLTPGNAQVGIPAVAGTNQKLRLGRVLRVSGTLGYINFTPETLAVLADGLA